MVDARYLLALCVALVLAGLLGIYTLARGESLVLWTVGFYTGAFLLILSVTQPIGFRWGYTGSGVRVAITMLTFVMLGVLGGLFSGVLQGARGDLDYYRVEGAGHATPEFFQPEVIDLYEAFVHRVTGGR